MKRKRYGALYFLRVGSYVFVYSFQVLDLSLTEEEATAFVAADPAPSVPSTAPKEVEKIESSSYSQPQTATVVSNPFLSKDITVEKLRLPTPYRHQNRFYFHLGLGKGSPHIMLSSCVLIFLSFQAAVWTWDLSKPLLITTAHLG